MKNLKVIISVSDPWEFGESIQWKEVKAKILEINDLKIPTKLILELENPLSYKGFECKNFIASCRHEGDTFLNLDSKECVSANFIDTLSNSNESKDSFDASGWRGGIAFIGGLKKG